MAAKADAMHEVKLNHVKAGDRSAMSYVAGGLREKFVNATRVQQSFTAQAEKRALAWLAARTPAAIHSDHLTLLGFAAQLGAGACLAVARAGRWWLLSAVVCIALNWLGDSLDGTLARFRNRQRPRYGFYVDHMIDSAGAAALMLGLGASALASPWVAMAMLVSFLLLSIEAYLATYTLARFRMSHACFGPTEIRLLLIAGLLRAMMQPEVHVLGHAWRLFDVGGVIAAAGMLGMFAVAAAAHTRELYKEEAL